MQSTDRKHCSRVALSLWTETVCRKSIINIHLRGRFLWQEDFFPDSWFYSEDTKTTSPPPRLKSVISVDISNHEILVDISVHAYCGSWCKFKNGENFLIFLQHYFLLSNTYELFFFLQINLILLEYLQTYLCQYCFYFIFCRIFFGQKSLKHF